MAYSESVNPVNGEVSVPEMFTKYVEKYTHAVENDVKRVLDGHTEFSIQPNMIYFGKGDINIVIGKGEILETLESQLKSTDHVGAEKGQKSLDSFGEFVIDFDKYIITVRNTTERVVAGNIYAALVGLYEDRIKPKLLESDLSDNQKTLLNNPMSMMIGSMKLPIRRSERKSTSMSGLIGSSI
jgi:hypothetical protein